MFLFGKYLGGATVTMSGSDEIAHLLNSNLYS